ncbi:5'/3'-nucleotidase SurE [Wolbachia endosymbiont of Cruorifilaria tuberocauda]|uniref:5'/3'-nucleotidase SurE n=1 Tax=Wolbachia endosymbiont of Cruorifilaria tuberocauda TaxID=1812111 RepID=UPI00158E4DB0|nr:5'/3'-nucleotidase SurE [Wolbachia endosymbiont of Cruorifilaria tuberocauda]QKX01641.1 5'/3'-nucleotidase SurE [Wolbachia endosymbiont of Cruorifilaria tuberocauda]
MIILITNDDGFESEGIKLLKEIAQNFASEIWVVAPDTDRSGAARSLDYRIRQSIKINQHGKREFSVSGTPADCIIIALNKIMNKKPNLVLSGVNIGSNVGDDVCYSGTIGAVMESAARFIPSIALSQVYHNEINWHNTKVFAPKITAKLVEVGWPKNIAMSVNFPATKKVKGVEFTEQGEYNLDRDLTFTENLDGSLSLGWSRKHSGSGSVGKTRDGFITITPIKLDFTDYDTLNVMKNSYASKFFP